MKKLLVLLLSFGLMLRIKIQKVKSHMFRLISKQLQIFRRIILPILTRFNRKMSTLMMNNFFRKEIPTDYLFHNKICSFNISSLGLWMRGVINNNIALATCSFSTFPTISFFSSWHITLQLKNTLFRKLSKAQFVISSLLSVFDYRQKKSVPSIATLSIALLLLLSSNVYSADQWDKTEPAGSISASDLDFVIGVNNEALDRLVIGYREGVKIEYLSASTITVTSGQVACANSAGSVVRWRRNTSDTTVSWTNIEAGGSESASQTYYLWAVADTDVTTFTVVVSTSSTSPVGSTYRSRLGSFYNNSSSNIENISNDNAVTEVLVSTGTVANGGTIPLPSGYVQSQCKWMVSINTLQTGEDSIGGVETCTSSVWADSNRLVTCKSYSPQWGWHTGTANFIIIGVK